jgi:hypothetical protein
VFVEGSIARWAREEETEGENGVDLKCAVFDCLFSFAVEVAVDEKKGYL